MAASNHFHSARAVYFFRVRLYSAFLLNPLGSHLAIVGRGYYCLTNEDQTSRIASPYTRASSFFTGACGR
jgi:hypothetical protein